ncbi:MAG: hypothetical protein AAF564_08180 [Bacteroidota bacterium]
METVYLVSLLVGGFFVLLSVLGGDSEADTDFEADMDVDFDAELDVDLDVSLETDLGGDISAGPGFIDLLSIRALFLFAAFFGLTGYGLTWVDTNSVFTLVAAITVGLLAGLGGNYVIKRFGYAEISSDVTLNELKGKTGKVLLPFTAGEKGKISVVVKGHQLRLVARPLDDSSEESFQQGEEIVVVRTKDGVVEVVKPT